mmetsp:Transcript_11441/g.32840  ORF Transcript_11441/g.32840 Transcript_11441/m.32840 type:complete len:216 (+) Transcript_11441:64-711(+)
MAGLGRRTHYRKHLTDSVLHDLPEPDDDERIAKVVSTRGSNQFDIVLALYGGADGAGIDEQQQQQRTPQLAILPTKFHKLVWVKRNDFVIVQAGGEDEENDVKGIRYIITHILYKDQVKHLKSKGLWPDDDSEFSSIDQTNEDPVIQGENDNDGEEKRVDDEEDGQEDGGDDDDDDGIVYNSAYDDDDDLFVNTNRINKMTIEESSSDEDSSDDE